MRGANPVPPVALTSTASRVPFDTVRDCSVPQEAMRKHASHRHGGTLFENPLTISTDRRSVPGTGAGCSNQATITEPSREQTCRYRWNGGATPGSKALGVAEVRTYCTTQRSTSTEHPLATSARVCLETCVADPVAQLDHEHVLAGLPEQRPEVIAQREAAGLREVILSLGPEP